jgi:cell division septation protein DedD
MSRTVVALALGACLMMLGPAAAQSLRGGPAELPPADFAGEQYVDSRGCVFLKAGHGGQVTWVRRIGADRKTLCGYPPSRTTMARAREALASEPVQLATAARPAAAPAAAPARPVAAVPAPAAPPAAVAPVAAARAAEARLANGCPARAPEGVLYDLVGGGRVLVCSAPGVRFTGRRPGDDARVRPLAASSGVALAATADPRQPQTAVPKGYRAAWTDDRLNPRRGMGTAEGAAMMRVVWTDELPQRLVVDATPRRRVAVSSKADPAVPAGPAAAGAAGVAFVQVGSFAVPENAARVVRQLGAAGLPVQVLRATLKGRAVEVVRAGPFAGESDLRAALAAVRAAGFADAVVRR